MSKNKKIQLKQEDIKKLEKFYSQIPDTEGCLDNIETCKGWCCKLNNPQVLACEFLYIWKQILKEWDIDDIANLVERCLQNYFSDMFNKSCVFWDRESKLCKIHLTRPFNCRLFGITPEDEYNARAARLRDAIKDDVMARVEDQCNLIHIVGDKTVDSDVIDKWWKDLNDIEIGIGVDPKNIVDRAGGTYLTYHDHILLNIVPLDMMEQLSALRANGSYAEKQDFINKYMEIIRNSLRQSKKNGPEK